MRKSFLNQFDEIGYTQLKQIHSRILGKKDELWTIDGNLLNKIKKNILKDEVIKKESDHEIIIYNKKTTQTFIIKNYASGVHISIEKDNGLGKRFYYMARYF